MYRGQRKTPHPSHALSQRVLSISTDQDYSDSAESPLEVEDNFKIDEEMEIHMQAKKIVRKVLHVACKRWDYMNEDSLLITWWPAQFSIIIFI